MKLVQILGIIAVAALICAVPFVAEAAPPSDSLLHFSRTLGERGQQPGHHRLERLYSGRERRALAAAQSPHVRDGFDRRA